MKLFRTFMLLTLLLVVQAAQAQTTGTNWTGEFFNTSDLSGGVIATVSYPNGLNYNWGTGKPRDANNDEIAAVNADNFSVRFTSTQSFPQNANYTFRTLINDGVRVYIDGALVLDEFHAFTGTVWTYDTYTFNAALAAGEHTIVVEMVEYDAEAIIQFAWQMVGVITTPITTPSDGRFCFGAGEAPAALYAVSGGLNVYRVSGSNGDLAFRITPDDLKALPDHPEHNLEIVSSGSIGFYKLTTGEYQVNVLSGSDHKLHTCIFSGIPPVGKPSRSTINIYGK